MGKGLSTMWFRLPVEAGAPPLTSGNIGFDRVVARPAESFHMQVSVFDSPRSRLLRAGVTIAHRRRDARPGEWYVAAPTWPGLPDEATYELDADGQLPEEVRRKASLFLRHEPLGPFAVLECERRAYTLRGGDEDLISIHDDLITVRRGEDVRPQVREITMVPLEKIAGQQREFIQSAMTAVAAVRLEDAPTLAQRLGAPATAPTSFRPPEGMRKGMSLEEFASETFTLHLYRIMISELTDDPAGTKDVVDRLLLDLRGLSVVLEPEWRSAFETQLLALAAPEGAGREAALLDVIDTLVGAVRAPHLGDHSLDDARTALYERFEQALLILFDRCRALEVGGPDESWAAALRSAEQLDAAATVLEPLFGKPARKLHKRFADVLAPLRASVRPPDDVELTGMSPEEAFDLGRDLEHARWNGKRARKEFIAAWPDHVQAGRKALRKLRKKLQ